MNQHIDDRRLIDHLGSLPEPELPEGLFERVRVAVAVPGSRPVRRRRPVLTWALASAASLAALGVVLLWPGDSRPPPAPVAADESAADAATLVAQIRALDRRLQSRIAEGAKAEELDELWQQRRWLSARLDTTSTGINPIRI
jgi:hypothetical protein